MVAKVRERPAASKQEAQKYDVERFNPERLSEVRLGNSIGLRFQTGLQLWRTKVIART